MAPQTVTAGTVELAYETFGEQGDPPVVLVMGLGTQMIWWEDEFCADLAARGHFVVRFDNRDCGLSTHIEDAPTPNVMAALTGDTSSASYTLDDMADDTTHLLEALGLEAAHFAGASMGGMIAQTIAIRHPERVRSLTSIMSTTGDPAVGQPTEHAMQALMAPMPSNREEALDRTLQTWRTIRSPGFAFDEDKVRELAEISYERAFDPGGFGRQLVAIFASGDRTDRLRAVEAPALVIHGDADPLIQPSGGEATAAAIPGAELLMIEGMGHDLPRGAWDQILEAIAGIVRRGEER